MLSSSQKYLRLCLIFNLLFLIACSEQIESVEGIDSNSGFWKLPKQKKPIKINYSVIPTAVGATTLEAFMVSAGSYFALRTPVYNSILIRHPKGDLLFDAGLGLHAQDELDGSDLNVLDKWVLQFEQHSPVIEQLQRQGIQPQQIQAIIPSHLHWDHLSGALDFSGVPVLVADHELTSARSTSKSGFIESTLGEDLNWQPLIFRDQSYGPYTKSLDYFDDGSVVLVPLNGHTSGHIGLVLNLPTGESYFFIGDAAWLSLGVDHASPRPWFIRSQLEFDEQSTEQQLQILQQIQLHNPHMTIVPAHDDRVIEKLAIFPDLHPQF